jgi:hypothetical protein
MIVSKLGESVLPPTIHEGEFGGNCDEKAEVGGAAAAQVIPAQPRPSQLPVDLIRLPDSKAPKHQTIVPVQGLFD